jgi:phosphonate transport system substrate-binding protein
MYKLGYGDPNSTSGFLVPNIFLFKKANIDPAKHFKAVVAQGPRANFLGVTSKQVDVAINNTEDMEIFKKEFPDKYKDIKVIWTSQAMPDHPMLVSRDMPDALRTKVEEFFLKYGADKSNQAHAATLKNIRGLSGFRKSDNSQLKPISILETHNEVAKVEANTALSAEEKKQRLAEISSRMQKVNALISGQ